METMLEKEVKFIKLQLLVILLVIPLKILQAHLLTFLLSLWLFFPSFLDLNLPKFTLFLDLLIAHSALGLSLYLQAGDLWPLFPQQ